MAAFAQKQKSGGEIVSRGARIGTGIVLFHAEVRICLGYRTMKSPEAAIRAIRFDADEKSRKVSDLEQMIREFEVMASDLERQIQAEEDRTGIRDAAHFAYSTFARSAAQRRDNLVASANGLRGKLEAAVRDRDEALEQVTKANSTDPRTNSRNRPRTDRLQGSQFR